MVVWTILDHFGPVHFRTVPRPFPNIARSLFREVWHSSKWHDTHPFLSLLGLSSMWKRTRRASSRALSGLLKARWKASPQIPFEPALGAYQSLGQKIKVPLSRIFSFFLQFWGSEGNFSAAGGMRRTSSQWFLVSGCCEPGVHHIMICIHHLRSCYWNHRLASGLLVEWRCNESLEPQLDSRVMPYKTWLRVCWRGTYHWHDCYYVRLFGVACLIHNRHVPYWFLNKVAYARAGAHTLLTTQFSFEVLSLIFVWWLFVWQHASLQTIFISDYGVMLSLFWTPMSKFLREFAHGFDGIFFQFIHVFVIIWVWLFFDQMQTRYSRVLSQCHKVGHSLGQFFVLEWGIFFRNIVPPRSLGDFQSDGIRLRNTVANLTEGRPRIQWGTAATSKPWLGSGLFASWRAYGKQMGLCAWFCGVDVAICMTCFGTQINV